MMALSLSAVLGKIPVGSMTMRLKLLFLATASLLVANLAGAREADHNGNWLAQQEKFNKRIEASDRRATRSICADLCKEPKRPAYEGPEDSLEPNAVAEATYERARTPYQMQFEIDGIQEESE